MDTRSTVLMLVTEAVFFTGLLVACLKLAARNYGARIQRLAEEVGRAKLLVRAAPDSKVEQHDQTHQGNLKIQQQLRNRIRLLQERVQHLEKIEEAYKSLKGGIDKSDSGSGSAGRRIVVGTTADRDSGVDPAYLAGLSRRQNADQATASTQRSSHELRSMQKKLDEQRSIISRLEQDLQRADFSADVKDIKAAQKDSALKKLKALESSLLKSQTNAHELETSFSQVRKELQETRAKLELSEATLSAVRQDGDADSRGQKNNSFTIISRDLRPGDEPDAHDNLLAEEALRNYQLLKTEVDRLRENTQAQRQLIFTLEKQILDLKQDIDSSDLTQEQRDEKALEIAKLQRLLQETEGCVEVLESEVSYLQDKIEVLAKPVATLVEEQKQNLSQDERAELISSQLKKTTAMLKRAAAVRAELYKTLALAQNQNPSLEVIAGHLLNALEPLAIDAHLTILTRDAQVDVANCQGVRRPQLQQLHDAIHRKITEPLAVEGGYILVYKRLGVITRGSLSEITSLGRLHDSMMFVLIVGETVISILEERRTNGKRQSAVQHLVDGVKTNLNQISVQSKYQRDEAQRIIESFIKELNSTLQTVNASDTQRRLFSEMMEETKQRMALLLESDVIIDQSFSRLLQKLDKGSKPQ